MDSLQGKIIGGHYKLLRMIGEGGMGSVWEAEHTTILSRFAVKVMHQLEGEDEGLKLRFFREAQAASSIGHPNIIEVFDVGVEDGIAYIVMEFLEGKSLVDMINEQGPLPPLRVVSIVLQVLSALHAAHNKGIVHRDIKPDNVFVAVDFRMREDVKLLDFGIAKILDEVPENVKLTQTGTVLGTPCYLSPEQASGKTDIDERIDIWAIGVMMYEMLSGQAPYLGENYNEVLCNILTAQAPPIGDVVLGVPPALAAVVNKAMSKDREQRYRDVGQMIRDLMPLNDHFDEQMGTASAKAVMDSAFYSIPNAGQNGSSAQKKNKDYRIFGAPKVRQKHTDGKRFPRSRRASMVVLGIALLLFLAGIIAFLPSGSETEKEVLNDATQQSSKELARGQEENRISGASVSPMVATESKTHQGLGSSGKGVESPKEMVTIELLNLPPRAKVFLGKKRVFPPLEVPASLTKTTLRVTCPGYRPYTQQLILAEDMSIDAKLKKISSRGSSTKSGKRQRSKVWRNNPFK